MNGKKPISGVAVIIKLKNGEIHEGHYIKNANYKEKNVNRWRLYANNSKGKTVPDEEVEDWMYKDNISDLWNQIQRVYQKNYLMPAT